MGSNKEQIKRQAIKCLDSVSFSPCTKKTRELYVVLINGKRVSLNGKNRGGFSPTSKIFLQTISIKYYGN